MLQSRKRKKNIARRLPVERTHGEIIILPLTDSKLFRKIIKRIETMRGILQIGELAGKLSDDFRHEHNQIPWQQIKATRNIVAHSYGSVDPVVT